MVDLQTIMDNMIAVRCGTEEQARDFIGFVWRIRPDACKRWVPGEHQWSNYREDTCYSLFDEGEGVCLYYSPACDYRNDGFKVIDFEDVVFETADFGELDAEVNLSILF